MDAQTLSKAMGGALSLARYEELLPHFNAAMIEAGATTPLRAAHFCSQVGHESGGLYYFREIHDGSNYEGRKDLGNTQAGDGRRFRGRGIIQLTGRYWATEFSKWAYSKGLVNSSTYFVDNPEQMETDKWGCKTASFYWTVARPQLNSLCDADDVVGATKAINGGTNGLQDRMNRLARAKTLGDKLLPGKVDTVTYYDTDWSARFDFGGPRPTSGIQRIVIHTTENAGGTPAANVANYQLTSRTGSYHVLVDTTGNRLRENTDDWITWSTGNNAGNVQGLNLSFVAQAGWSRDQWLAQEKMLRAGAKTVRYWCDKYNIPMSKVTTARGICGHGDLRAFGGTDHTDPGANFPWDIFIGYVKGATAPATTTPSKEATLSTLDSTRIRLGLDQFVGSEKNGDGLPTFTGWNMKSLLIAARKKKFVSLTLAEMLAVSIAGTDNDLKAARAAANGD